MKIKVFIKSGSSFVGESSWDICELQRMMKTDGVIYLKHESGLEYLIPKENIDVIEIG